MVIGVLTAVFFGYTVTVLRVIFFNASNATPLYNVLEALVPAKATALTELGDALTEAT